MSRPLTLAHASVRPASKLPVQSSGRQDTQNVQRGMSSFLPSSHVVHSLCNSASIPSSENWVSGRTSSTESTSHTAIVHHHTQPCFNDRKNVVSGPPSPNLMLRHHDAVTHAVRSISRKPAVILRIITAAHLLSLSVSLSLAGLIDGQTG